MTRVGAAPCAATPRSVVHCGKARDVSGAGSPTLQDLKRLDFYNCPFFVDGVELLLALGKCDNLSETASFENFFRRTQEIDRRMVIWHVPRYGSSVLHLPHLGILDEIRQNHIAQRRLVPTAHTAGDPH
jgi:hypothetical protein